MQNSTSSISYGPFVTGSNSAIPGFGIADFNSGAVNFNFHSTDATHPINAMSNLGVLGFASGDPTATALISGLSSCGAGCFAAGNGTQGNSSATIQAGAGVFSGAVSAGTSALSTSLTVNGTSNGTLPGLIAVTDSTSAATNTYGYSYLAPSIPTGGSIDWIWGKAGSNGNSLALIWNQTASTATNNWCLAVWGMGSNCNVQGFLGGALKSIKNTLDDGAGNVTTLGTVNVGVDVGVTGNVNVQGAISSTINTQPASITNSGVVMTANPNVADLVYYDSTRTTDNHIVEGIWFQGAYQLRMKSDSQAQARAA